MDIQKELAFLDEPEWVEAALMVALDNDEIELVYKIMDTHPEVIDHIEDWCRENGIELPE